MQETQFSSLDGDDPLEKGMSTHSSILAWRIPMDRGAWQVPVFLCSLAGYSPWVRKESDMTKKLTISVHFGFVKDISSLSF